MEFAKVVGNIPTNLVKAAEQKLSIVLFELSIHPTTRTFETKTLLLGDPLVFSLAHAIDHVCTTKFPTAATDGKRYYWNPNFILKQSLPGLRFVLMHEVWHAIYMHPQRRGSRLPKLWNICVDFVVNGVIFEELKTRAVPDYENVFKNHLGNYYTVEQYAELLRDPSKRKAEDKVKGNLHSKEVVPDSDEELTDDQLAQIEQREKVTFKYFADPNLPEKLRSPEALYEYFYAIVPKCPDCGKVGVYPKPKKKKEADKKDEAKDKSKDKKEEKDSKEKSDSSKGSKPSKKGSKSQEKSEKGEEPSEDGKNPSDEQGDQPGDQPSDEHSHGGDEPCDHDHGNEGCGHGEPGDSGEGEGEGGDGDSCEGEGHGCGTCGDGEDIFDMGGTVDDHMDPQEAQDKLAKRMYEAIESAKRLPGYTPSGMEDELAELVKPQIKWQDVIRIFHKRCRDGNSKNDWTRFKTRAMCWGDLRPKRIDNKSNFICLLDTSGSMSPDDISHGLSQLQGLDEKTEGTVVPADCEIYWESATKIRGTKVDDLRDVKVVGRGGTMFHEFMNNYKQEMPGDYDFVIMITDGFLAQDDLDMMENPGVQVFWVVVNSHDFKPPFGKVYNLYNN